MYTLSKIFGSVSAVCVLALLSCVAPASADSHVNRAAHALVNPTTCKNSSDRAKAPQCCAWYAVRRDLVANVFKNTCGDEVRAALRASFHDAAAFSKSLANKGKYPGGGTDGSLITFLEELNRPENFGLGPIGVKLHNMAKVHRVSPGDLIQFAAAVGVTLCEGAPRLLFYTGRPPATRQSPHNLLPSPGDDVPTLISRFHDMGLTTSEMVVLTGAHTIAALELAEPGNDDDDDSAAHDLSVAVGNTTARVKKIVDKRAAGDDDDEDDAFKFDQSLHTWDTQFFIDTMQKAPPTEVTRLFSDVAIARSSITKCRFEAYAGNQQHFNDDFTAAMLKMSLIGQTTKNVQHFVECTEAIPKPKQLKSKLRYPKGGLKRSCPKK